MNVSRKETTIQISLVLSFQKRGEVKGLEIFSIEEGKGFIGCFRRAKVGSVASFQAATCGGRNRTIMRNSCNFKVKVM